MSATKAKDLNEVCKTLERPLTKEDYIKASTRVVAPPSQGQPATVLAKAPIPGANLIAPREHGLGSVSGIYYNSAAKEFVIPIPDGGFSRLNSFDVRAILSGEQIAGVIRGNSIDFAGPLSGYSVGERIIQGNRVLVTRANARIKPKAGPWDTIRELLSILFGRLRPGHGKVITPEDMDLEQLDYFFSWLAFGEQHAFREFIPGQVTAIAGRPGCGKNFIQERIITPIFGGSHGDPFPYLIGQTRFNSEMFGWGHYMIADRTSHTDYRSRREFGERLKGLVANRYQRCEVKGGTVIMLDPRFRVTMSLNSEPDNLRILPPLEESLSDKIMLLWAGEAMFASPLRLLRSPAEVDDYAGRITEELPHFLYFIQEMEFLGEEMRDPRFGVKAYHAPEMLSALNDISPEYEVLGLIMGTIEEDEWEGSSSELCAALTKYDAKLSFPARQMLKSVRTLSNYLSTLKAKHPDLIRYREVHGYGRWSLNLKGLRKAAGTI